MCNIIIESNAIQNLVENLQENYKNQNLAFVTTKKDYLKNKNNLQPFKDNVANVKMCYIDECVKCNEIFVKLLENQLKDCSVIICFGSGYLVDLVKIVATKMHLKYIVVPSGLSYGNYISKNAVFLDNNYYATNIATLAPESLYVDTEILLKSNSKDVGGLFALVLSYNLMVCKMLYSGVSESEIDDFKQLLKGVNIFTSENIVLKEGKTKLFKLLLEIQLWLSNRNMLSNIDLIVSLFNKFYNSNNFSFGEIGLIFSILILTLHEKIITNKICVPSLNIGKRVERIKTLFAKQETVETVLRNFESNIDEFDGFVVQKEIYLKNIQNALWRVQNNLSMLKRIYVDKGVVYSNINIDNFYKTLSVACDIINDKYLSVLSVIGAV